MTAAVEPAGSDEVAGHGVTAGCSETTGRAGLGVTVGCRETTGSGEVSGCSAASGGGAVSLRFGFIGMGRVGAALAGALRQAGHQIVAVTARSAESRERAESRLPGVPVASAAEVIALADVVFLTVPDDQVRPAAEALAAGGGFHPGQLVAHASGALGLEALAPAAQRGALTAAIHPAMTFTGYSLDLERLRGAPVGVTTSVLALPLVQALVQSIGAVPFTVEEAARPLYHCGLTYGANYLVTLIAGARRILETAGISDPVAVMRPLLQAALDNALESGSNALTGPLVRGDQHTLELHQQALTEADAGTLAQLAKTYAQLAEATREELRQQQLQQDSQQQIPQGS